MSTTLDPHAEAEKAKGRAPQPPVEEQVGRLNRTRESMERHGIDVLLLYGSAGSPEMTRYLAGYVHVFPGASSLLVIPLEGTPVPPDRPALASRRGRRDVVDRGREAVPEPGPEMACR